MEAVALDPAFEAAVFEAEATVFEAAVFDVAVFADALAVLLGISPLLFLEDFPAERLAAVVRAIEAAVRARAFVPPRRAVDVLELVFLRVFCDTARAWMPTPSWMFTPESFRTHKQVKCTVEFGNALKIAHFPQKSMIYARARALADFPCLQSSKKVNIDR